MTDTRSTTYTVKSVTWIRHAKQPSRVAAFIVWYLETICELTGHPGGCVLFNSFRVGRFGTWWHKRVIVRLFDASDTFTRWERA